MKKVAFLGDLNADIIMDGLEATPVPDHEVGCSRFDIAVGASSCIAASAYACLGGDAWFCGRAGDDMLGAFMLESLASCGVHTGLVRREAAEKTGATVNLVEDAGRYQVTYPGAMGRFSLSDVPDELFRGMAHLHVSGVYQAASLLPDVAALLARAQRAGATTSLDCQWDPSGQWEGLSQWLPRVDWLFANEEEALSMTRRTGDALEALEDLARRCKCPVVKRGAHGATLMVEGRPVTVASPTVSVVDTIGAGDNFDAAFLHAVIEQGLPLPECGRFATAAAARSCTFRGGTAARSTLQDVQRFMETNR
jgi:sugar/nucleoside kinase (ribokinase family)